MILRMEREVNFPRRDISEDTAEILELLLLNRELVDASHMSAEQAHVLFRLGHRAIEQTSHARINGERLAAFSYGIGAYEAVRTLVQPKEKPLTEQDAGMKVIIVNNALTSTFADTVVEAREKFDQEMPRTKYVIGQSATRFHAMFTDYALSGAAIARDLELQDIPA